MCTCGKSNDSTFLLTAYIFGVSIYLGDDERLIFVKQYANVCISIVMEAEMANYTTLKDVAELAGTTVGTVSYVLNDKKDRYVSEETREKVLKAAAKLNYIKCNGASSLKGKDRKLVGILIPQFENQFFTRIIIAAEDVFVKSGYDMIICDTYDDPEREKAIIHRLLAQRVDGIIVTPTCKGAENTKLIRDVGMNMVVVDRPLETVPDYFWVTTDNYGCGKRGIEYLIEKGHKKIGYVGWKSNIRDLDARRLAVLTHSQGKAEVIVEEGDFSAKAGYELTGKLLSEHPDITAIFYGFNIQAKGGVDCLVEKNLNIPHDISVLLIGSPEWSYTGMNKFARVDMNDSELGTTAAKVLLAQIQGKPLKPQRYIHDCSIIDGQSVENRRK